MLYIVPELGSGSFPYHPSLLVHTDHGASHSASTRSNVRAHNGWQFYIYAFFAQFPLFPYNPFRPFVEELRRMCEWFGWNKADRGMVYNAFHHAIVRQFNATYGVDANNLASWQLLCIVLQIHPVPGDLETCRKVRFQHSVFVPVINHKYVSRGCSRPTSTSSTCWRSQFPDRRRLSRRKLH